MSASLAETTVSGAEDNMETVEAAEVLLNMESPNNILDEKRMSKSEPSALDAVRSRPKQKKVG